VTRELLLVRYAMKDGSECRNV